VKFVHVPYQGSAPAIMGLLAGDVQATTVAYAELQQHVETGKLRTLAVMAPKRLDNLPSVPTMKEKGADLQFSVWRGIGLPKATPADAVEKWRTAARQVAQSQDFQALMRKQNLTPSYADQPQFTADVARQEEAFKALVPKLNLKP
jgi:tripartite-type tricarboxylate transporter receptor subunit TctC